MKKKFVAVFGSSKCRAGELSYQTALEVGRALAREGYTVVNGGYGGVMEASAKGAKEAGGKTVGITTREFSSACNPYIDEEKKVSTWQERVMELMSRANAYVILDGGTGTLVEFSVAVEMINKGLIPQKPIVIYGPFWKSVKAVLKKNKEINLDFVQNVSSPRGIVEALKSS